MPSDKPFPNPDSRDLTSTIKGKAVRYVGLVVFLQPRTGMFTFTAAGLLRDPPRNHDRPRLGSSTPTDGGVTSLPQIGHLGRCGGLAGASRRSAEPLYDSGALDLSLAPREAVPDAPVCSAELISHMTRSSSLPPSTRPYRQGVVDFVSPSTARRGWLATPR